jgi:hypothetical protein
MDEVTALPGQSLWLSSGWSRIGYLIGDGVWCGLVWCTRRKFFFFFEEIAILAMHAKNLSNWAKTPRFESGDGRFSGAPPVSVIHGLHGVIEKFEIFAGKSRVEVWRELTLVCFGWVRVLYGGAVCSWKRYSVRE